jgi:hypothetical protein
MFKIKFDISITKVGCKNYKMPKHDFKIIQFYSCKLDKKQKSLPLLDF